jgi:hypothetical protein
MIDAILRIVIGAISAAVFISLLKSDVVTLQIGDAALSNETPDDKARFFLFVVAFIAGFVERLVPDFLEKSVAAARPSPETPLPPVLNAAAAGAVPVAPVGNGDFPVVPPAPSETRAAATEQDCCLTPEELAADTAVTHDVELPPATGGVEQLPAAAPKTA